MPTSGNRQVLNPSGHLSNGILVTSLLQTTKKFSAAVANIIVPHGYSVDEWLVLRAIQHDDGCSVSQISAASGCSGAALTRAVDKLVMHGLVYREASQIDRRKVVVFITKAGRKVSDAINTDVIKLEDALQHTLLNAGLSSEAFTEVLKALGGLPALSQEDPSSLQNPSIA